MEEEEEGVFVSNCSCIAKGACDCEGEQCLQVVMKQCPPKKRFKGCKPRPILVKPSTSRSVALDRLVEVALSPTDLSNRRDDDDFNVDHSSSAEFASGEQCKLVTNKDREGSDVAGAMESSSLHFDAKVIKRCSNKSSKQAPTSVTTTANKLPRFSLAFPGMEAQKLKKLSSLNELPQPPSSPTPVHADSKRFTPRFKSLLDISC